VAEAAINNVSKRPNIRHIFTLNLTYDTPPEKMEAIVGRLRTLFRDHPMTADVHVAWKTFGAHSLDIEILYWCKAPDYRAFTTTLEEMNLKIIREVEGAGLSFAFPTQTIELKKED
jgi:MscS family membrane protein